MPGGPGSGQPGLGTQGEQEQLQQPQQDPLPEEQERSQGLHCEEHEGKLLMVRKQQAKFLLKCYNKFVNYEHVLSVKLWNIFFLRLKFSFDRIKILHFPVSLLWHQNAICVWVSNSVVTKARGSNSNIIVGTIQALAVTGRGSCLFIKSSKILN